MQNFHHQRMFFLILLAVVVNAQEERQCQVYNRRGECMESLECLLLRVGHRPYKSTDPGLSGLCDEFRATVPDVSCCVPAIYGGCTAAGVAGECRHSAACDTGAVSSASGAVGCEEFEKNGIFCCAEFTPTLPATTDTEPATDTQSTTTTSTTTTTTTKAPTITVPRITPKPTPALPALPSGTPCSAYGVVGVCTTQQACAAPRSLLPSRGGFVTGCERLAQAVQCCSTGKAPNVALPPLPTTVNIPARGGTITPCQAAALLQRAGVPASEIPILTCIAKFESGYQCDAANTMLNRDGTADYGSWQANSQYWCSGGQGPNRGNGCNVRCEELLNCEKAAQCAATILRLQGPRAWAVYFGAGSRCSGYVLPACGISRLLDDDGNEIDVFTGEETTGGAANGTAAPNGALETGAIVGIAIGAVVALGLLIAAVVVLVGRRKRRSFDVNEEVPAHAMVSARSDRSNAHACAQCGKSYATAPDLAHHVALRHP